MKSSIFSVGDEKVAYVLIESLLDLVHDKIMMNEHRKKNISLKVKDKV